MQVHKMDVDIEIDQSIAIDWHVHPKLTKKVNNNEDVNCYKQRYPLKGYLKGHFPEDYGENQGIMKPEEILSHITEDESLNGPSSWVLIIILSYSSIADALGIADALNLNWID